MKPLLPDYLYLERARPEVFCVAWPLLPAALADVTARYGPGTYRLQKVLPTHFNYTTKPEIPSHCFRAPWPWERYPGMVVLAAVGSPAAADPALRPEAFDVEQGAEALHQAAGQAAAERQLRGGGRARGGGAAAQSADSRRGSRFGPGAGGAGAIGRGSPALSRGAGASA